MVKIERIDVQPLIELVEEQQVDLQHAERRVFRQTANSPAAVLDHDRDLFGRFFHVHLEIERWQRPGRW